MGKEKDKVVVRPDVDEELVPPKFEVKTEVKKQVVSDEFSLATIATQTAEVIVNSKNEELSDRELLVLIANDLKALKKGLL